ncbi:hypothetical protein BDV96DRAFT_566937 [Lophiotrema nucula]|uniref:Uncharacterized protein n=1 Tax=Lophiotrema nucula TaxID=690887 RepID=A0A6A5ZPU7_9PLEO|nr:hypothetical protein BDV96DRAFT_566937 [Lophiotrema nucula]
MRRNLITLAETHYTTQSMMHRTAFTASGSTTRQLYLHLSYEAQSSPVVDSYSPTMRSPMFQHNLCVFSREMLTFAPPNQSRNAGEIAILVPESCWRMRASACTASTLGNNHLRETKRLQRPRCGCQDKVLTDVCQVLRNSSGILLVWVFALESLEIDDTSTTNSHPLQYFLMCRSFFT